MTNFYDPLRKTDVAATPEEQVRQWFIGELGSTFKVPSHMMMSEVGFSYGSKRYRADILVYDRAAKPLCVVECKRPEVDLDEDVLRQAMRYNAVLDVRWLIVTNGTRTLIYRRRDGSFVPSDRIPVYEQMLCPL